MTSDGRMLTLSLVGALALAGAVRAYGSTNTRGSRGSAVRTAVRNVPVDLQQIEETLQDVVEGRRSYSYDAPLRVSALDTPRGHYFVLDGHHRLVERIQAGDRTVVVELDSYIPRIERTGGAHRNMVAQKVNVAARVRRGSAARTAYPGPLVPPTGSPETLAEAYLALRAAVPSLLVLRALYALAKADLDGAPPPTATEILSTSLYFPSPENMKVWPAAVALSTRLRATIASDARKEATADARDARWEAQAIRVDPGAMPSARALRGRDVWLYHGTTSAFLPRILREGLVPGKDARPPHKRLLGLRANLGGGQVRFQPHVFLTADDSGRAASASWYVRQAAHVHGGDPAVLRVIVPYDALAPDPDDADIPSGRYQFVIDHVPPEAIREVNGARRGKSK